MDRQIMEQVLAEEWFAGSGHLPDALTIGANGVAIAEVWMRGHPEVEAARRDLMLNAGRMARLLREWIELEAWIGDKGPCRFCGDSNEHTDECPISKAIALLFDLFPAPEPAEAKS